MIDCRCGDCRDVLPTLPAESFGACVTDPPYDLTSGNGRGFMGKAWDGTGVAFQPETWAAVLRVLKPGALLVACGGTRTYHRMVCAIEDAGFEIRDSILCGGLLAWVQGQGFPKGLDVGRSIDSHVCPLPGRHFWSESSLPKGDKARPDDHVCPLSDEGNGWRGYNVALKPAWEPIVVARKPLDGTVAENVLKWGCGGLNVDGCRVSTSAADTAAMERCNTPGSGRLHPREKMYSGAASGTGPLDTTAGRWPPNLLLCHHPDCVPCGERRVKTGTHIGRNRGGRSKSVAGMNASPDLGIDVGYADADGLETVTAYRCHESCPVRLLDEQSGESKSTGGRTVKRSGICKAASGRETEVWSTSDDPGYGDTGGASRFFPQFSWSDADLAPFLYEGKATRAEREDGLINRIPCAVCGGLATREHSDGKGGMVRCHRNIHNTVKPLSLMSWLVRLVTQPGGIVLDPFMGSGTTGVACIREGFDFIGIEQEAEYFPIAEARIKHEGRQQRERLGLFQTGS